MSNKDFDSASRCSSITARSRANRSLRSFHSSHRKSTDILVEVAALKMRYASWKIALQTLIEHRRIPTGKRLHYLKKYIGDQVKDTVESYFLLPPDDAFEECKGLLEEQYGNQFVIADAFRDRLKNWQRINPRDRTALQRCANFLRQYSTAIKSIGSLQVLNEEHAVRSTEKYLERNTATTTKGQKRTVKGSHQELMVLAVTDIVNQLIQARIQKKDVNLNSIKGKSASKYGLASQPRLVDIIAAVHQQYKKALVPKLKAKPVRTASGIAVVAVMCKPHRCPHIAMTGNICVYYPEGPDSDFEYSTQSCTSYEPTSMRAIRARYNPYLQTRHRVEQLKQLCYSVDKVEFIVRGHIYVYVRRIQRFFSSGISMMLYLDRLAVLLQKLSNIQRKAEQNVSGSQLKQDLTIIYENISVICYLMVAQDLKLGTTLPKR